MRLLVWKPHLLLCTSVIICLIQETDHKEGDLSCVVDYVSKMHCTWFKGSIQAEGPFYVHILSDDDLDYFCYFSARPDVENSFNCTTLIEEGFSVDDEYNLQLNSLVESGFAKEAQDFQPCLNIKLNPPFDIQCNFTNNHYTITWSVDPDLIKTIKEDLETKVEFKKENSSWVNALLKVVRRSTLLEIDPLQLERGTRYVARLRCKTIKRDDDDSYESQWSSWSSEINFATLSPDVKSSTMSNYMLVLLVTGTFALIVLYLFFSFRLSSRVKVLCVDNFPTAAKFFQPLYREYNGNFKDWTKCRSSRLQKNRTTKNIPYLDNPNWTVLHLKEDVLSNVELSARPLSLNDISKELDIYVSPSHTQGQGNVFLCELYPTLFQLHNDCVDHQNSSSYLQFKDSYVTYDVNGLTVNL
uniref:Interleukin-7 receptor subunit alpha n=1 Tax=Leptobrachium leishanense TaxID=445787 RepID=A0A8C5QSZ9_9ANUR